MQVANDNDDSKQIQDALNKTLDCIGEYGKRLTLIQLNKRYGISTTERAISVAELEVGLREIFGHGSELLVRKLKQELANQ